jgi:hypothetical protein
MSCSADDDDDDDDDVYSKNPTKAISTNGLQL